MKILVIPDIHLKSYIFIRAKELLRQGVADTAVCLMDIPDDWKKQFAIDEYAITFDEAIAFAKEFPTSLWCYGNHDLSYLWGKQETGYSPPAAYIVRQKLSELQDSLPEGISYVQKVDRVLFSHGGVSGYFVEKYVPPSERDNVSRVATRINALGCEEMWCDDSPIWYRPQRYEGRMYQGENVLQVVGHTPVDRIYKKGNVISCDVFSTYPDGKPIGTQEFAVVDTLTGEYEAVR